MTELTPAVAVITVVVGIVGSLGYVAAAQRLICWVIDHGHPDTPQPVAEACRLYDLAGRFSRWFNRNPGPGMAAAAGVAVGPLLLVALILGELIHALAGLVA